jgi:hypothetical protein
LTIGMVMIASSHPPYRGVPRAVMRLRSNGTQPLLEGSFSQCKAPLLSARREAAPPRLPVHAPKENTGVARCRLHDNRNRGPDWARFG